MHDNLDNLIGRTISSYKVYEKKSEWDDDSLDLLFTDGSSVAISSASYDGSDISVDFSTKQDAEV